MLSAEFKVGDLVRVVRIPEHILASDYPWPEVLRAFEAALGNTYRVEEVDHGGWVQFFVSEALGGIGVQPDCVELVERR